MSDDENFLSRWSQRKRKALAEDAASTAPAVADDASDDAPDLSALPNLEDLTGTSDITAFLKKGIPDHLRNAALRKVWALDPAVRDYVGDALDYAYDWNVPGGVPGSGEIAAGTDIGDMVSRIFGDKTDPEMGGEPESEKVIGYVAPQESPGGEPPSDEVGELSQDEPPTMNHAGSGIIVQNQVTASPVKTDDHVALQHKTRRHGGAVPRA